MGASFGEIFEGNCTALGLPCVTLFQSDLAALMDSVELDPGQELVVDLEARSVTSRAGSMKASMPEARRPDARGASFWDLMARRRRDRSSRG